MIQAAYVKTTLNNIKQITHSLRYRCPYAMNKTKGMIADLNSIKNTWHVSDKLIA
jgi:hypothetical protein